MDDDEFKEDDDDIHKVGVQNKNFRLVNKKTCEFKIDYDSSIHYYSTRLSIDLIYLPLGSYTMVYEMYIDDGITIDEIDAQSGTLTVGKINSRKDGKKTRSIIHFTKYTFASGFDDLDIDIKLRGKTDPQTIIYVVVYGVKGQVNNISVNLWDRFYYYDNSSVKYEASIDMNKKDITDVNKITTGDLDVNGQTDIKGNKIIGVGNGTSNSDAVNKSQLDELVTYVKTQDANLTDRVIRDINLIRNSLTKLQYRGGERGLVVGRWTCNPEVPGSNLPPCHWMDLSSVAPNSTPPHCVNSQLVSLPPVGIYNLLCLICITFVCYAHLNIFT